MIRSCIYAAAISASIVLVAHADPHDDGLALGSSQLNNSAAVVTQQNATTMPFYNPNPPQGATFGSSDLFGVGAAKITDCKNYVPGADKIANEECDAVNFLAKNPDQRLRIQLPPNDPSILAARQAINSAKKDQFADNGCVTKTTTTANEYRIESCNVYNPVDAENCVIGREVIVNAYSNYQCDQTLNAYENLTCNRTMNPQCTMGGSPISTYSTAGSGLFPTVSLSPTSPLGLYNYLFNLPLRCGTNGWASIAFNLDTVGQGSYMTINLGNLDDAAIVAVNGYSLWAGYPNNGPAYSGSYFSGGPQFQMGYSWSEAIGQTCLSTDWNGDCTSWASTYGTFTAHTKLLDYCPAGFAPVSQLSMVNSCTADGGCSNNTPASDSWYNVQGFFCNSEGKFLMNGHEGSGNWSGSYSGQMPLKVGMNTIQVFWGTGASGGACGNVTVSGQIYNVAASCTNQWSDGCAALELRAQ